MEKRECGFIAGSVCTYVRRHGLTVYPSLVLNLESSCFLSAATILGEKGWDLFVCLFCFLTLIIFLLLFFFHFEIDFGPKFTF